MEVPHFIIHFSSNFHCKSSIWGTPILGNLHFWNVISSRSPTAHARSVAHTAVPATLREMFALPPAPHPCPTDQLSQLGPGEMGLWAVYSIASIAIKEHVLSMFFSHHSARIGHLGIQCCSQ